MHPHRSSALGYASAASAAHNRVYGACAAEAAASETSGLSVGGCIRAWRYFGPPGWLHFYLRQKRNEWFTFATHARMSRGGSAPRSRALIHISPSCGHTQWVAPRVRIAQPRSGRAIRVVQGCPRLALFTWRRHRMLSE